MPPRFLRVPAGARFYQGNTLGRRALLPAPLWVTDEPWAAWFFALRKPHRAPSARVWIVRTARPLRLLVVPGEEFLADGLTDTVEEALRLPRESLRHLWGQNVEVARLLCRAGFDGWLSRGAWAALSGAAPAAADVMLCRDDAVRIAGELQREGRAAEAGAYELAYLRARQARMVTPAP